MNTRYSRRDFLKMSLLGAGAVVTRPWMNWKVLQSDFPDAKLIARNCTGGMIKIHARPTGDSAVIKTIYEDTLLPWVREVVGEAPSGLFNRRWVETPEGYLHLPSVQPVRNEPNKPLSSLPETSLGKGFWAEVSVPYVDIFMTNPPASPWLKAVPRPRLYYSQVLWVDDIKTNSAGQVLYRINEPYGSYGDVFWCAADAFRPITPEEIAPIRPEVADKKVVVNLSYQTLSCYEGNSEVYFCRIASGAKFDAAGNAVDKWSTPLGAHLPWRKVISIHMSGGSTGAGWDTPGIAWTTLFDPDGAAIHSTFWHNDFGTPRSHGCVNASPEDSKWIFRWATPAVTLDPGNVEIHGPGGTVIDVVES
jgi:hypothetical protein